MSFLRYQILVFDAWHTVRMHMSGDKSGSARHSGGVTAVPAKPKPARRTTARWCARALAVVLALSLVASDWTPARAVTAAQRAFIASLVSGARGTQDRFGVPASITMAQAILESGWGGSTLAKAPNNNLFGIKCGSTPSPFQRGCVTVPTREYLNGQWVVVNASFRTYASVADSILDHGYYLRYRGIYDAAFLVSYSPRQFAQAIARAGYATDPAYPTKLLGIASTYDLYANDFGQSVGSAITDPRLGSLSPRAAQVERVGSASYSAPLSATPPAAEPQPPPDWVSWARSQCQSPIEGQVAERRSCS